MELETEDDLKSRMRENCTYGSVRGSRQAFLKLKKKRKECRDCILDDELMAEEVKIETSPEPFRLKDGGEITIGGPGPSDLESAYQVFEVTIRDAFLKEGLVHLEEEISGEIRWKKKMLQEAVKMEGE